MYFTLQAHIIFIIFQIVYAWARDAPSLHLPKDVGFLIGKDSPIKYLVLQVHYMHRFPGMNCVLCFFLSQLPNRTCNHEYDCIYKYSYNTWVLVVVLPVKIQKINNEVYWFKLPVTPLKPRPGLFDNKSCSNNKYLLIQFPFAFPRFENSFTDQIKNCNKDVCRFLSLRYFSLNMFYREQG